MPESHRIQVDDGETITAITHSADDAHDRWLVCCHGLVSDKSGSYERRCRRAVEAGWNAVRFDARGCGESDGTFAASTLDARLADLRAVLEYIDPGRCVLFGSSFGAHVAFHAAPEDDRISAIVARAPVTDAAALDDYRDAVERDGEYVFGTGDRLDERFFRSLDRHDFDEVASSIAIPVAIFHGTADESVDVTDSFRTGAKLDTEMALFAFDGEGHLFSATAEQRMLRWTFEWLDKLDVTTS